MSNKKRRPSINWDKQIDRLISYSTRKGYIVHLKNEDGISFIDFDHNYIVIYSSMNETAINKEKQFYTLAHEIGHLLVLENKQEYKDTFMHSYKKFSSKTRVYKLAEIEEELEAWKHGLRLIKRLRLKINRKTYETYKLSLIETYMMDSLKSRLSSYGYHKASKKAINICEEINKKQEENKE